LLKVQQVNEELRAQHRQKKGVVVKGEHSAGKVAVGSGVGWGESGPHITHNVIGKFKYQTLVLTSACVRMQRHWRNKVSKRKYNLMITSSTFLCVFRRLRVLLFFIVLLIFYCISGNIDRYSIPYYMKLIEKNKSL
jgi:hypothetical protein